MTEPRSGVQNKRLNTPVLFLTFNRLDTTKQVFEAIRRARPPRLYLASDGPRDSRPGEEEKVKSVREYVLGHIDWECEVKTLFREKNLGCKYAVSGAISWFFENEEMGIILEDDCLPSNSFFGFCEELLNLYKDDERIFIISGYNMQNRWTKWEGDYFFSYLGGIWGWASWRRAWEFFDPEMKDLPNFAKRDGFRNLLGELPGKQREIDLFNVVNSNMDTWDYQWGFARHKNSGMACVPARSLVKNIGFGEGATHNYGKNTDGVEAHEMELPLKNNMFMVVDREYDALFVQRPTTMNRMAIILKQLLKRII